MESLRDRVLDIVKREGPVLPVIVARKVERDILFASAVLAELISSKLIMLTKGKIGSSPLYYAKGQEPKLQTLYSHIGDRPKRAFSLLKEKKVLRDKDCEPWQRVALREIQDFAKSVEVKIGDDSEIFWRWYLIEKEETENLIKVLLEGPKKFVEVPKEEIKKVEAPKEIKEPEKVIEKPQEFKKIDNTGLVLEVKDYFNKNKIEVLEETMVRKNSEIDYIVNILSEIGKLKYFVKVKSKKKVNEGDLSLARDLGREKKLPVLFLSKGDMTKKAKTYLEKNLKGDLVFKQIS